MKISGYITIRNAEQMGYPYKEAIRSLFNFCDEIVVCDTSDGTDKTTNQLIKLSAEFKGEFKLINNAECNWNAPNSGIYDGLNKAHARSHCAGDYCFQIDADEIVETTREEIEKMIKVSGLNEENPILALPVVEFWGSEGKVRIDVNPWKERLSLNLPHITHGIPSPLRKMENGLLYSHPGSDGCNVISKIDGMPVPLINFVKPKVEEVRKLAVKNVTATLSYEKWFNKTVNKMPTIYHFSWWSVYGKMLKYKHFWNDNWMRLYNEKRPDGYNPFFKKSFSEITDKEMIETANKIESLCGGYIFHNPIDLKNIPKTNFVHINKPIPVSMKEWCEKNKTPNKK